MVAEIISIGNELLNGSTVNGNAAYIGKELELAGIETRWISVVGDFLQDIKETITLAANRADIVIVTGGLGPTHDDKTRYAVSELLQKPLMLNEDVLKKIEKLFSRREQKMPESNRIQAEIPQTATILNNKWGTAPGFSFLYQKKPCYVLPGVPKEMQEMLHAEVVPKIATNAKKIVVHKLKVTGISESLLYDKLENLIQEIESNYIQLAFLPNPTGIVIRLSTQDVQSKIVKKYVKEISKRVGEWIYGKNNDTLESVVARLLISQKKTLAVAESCTGGLISHKLTNIPGSSEFFNRGFLTYSDQAKMELLSVPELTLMMHGAVSEETALAMAKGARKKSKTDIGLSITGIAGPGGGSKEKPVGLVYVGYSDKNQNFAKKFQLFKERLLNKERFAMSALDVLRRALLGIEQNSL